MQEFDEEGKLILEVNWDKDFKVSEKEAENIARREILSFIKTKYKDYPNFKTEVQKTDIRVYNCFAENNLPVWNCQYKTIELSIDAKTGKVIKIFEEINIP